MSTMNLTLIGMYNYDPTIFDDLTLPPEIDKQLFIDNLLMRSGEFELLYPSADFLSLQSMYGAVNGILHLRNG